jgi:anti-sigma factor RsiW
MNDAEYQGLLEAAWRRKLTPEEEARLEAWLMSHPKRQAEWEEELSLSQGLRQMPDAPLASNFTARVLQALDREAALAGRPSRLAEWLTAVFRRPAAGLAWATVLLLAGWLGYQQVEKHNRRAAAQDFVVLLNKVATQPTSLENFDAVRNLPQADDEQLYAVLNSLQ